MSSRRNPMGDFSIGYKYVHELKEGNTFEVYGETYTFVSAERGLNKTGWWVKVEEVDYAIYISSTLRLQAP